jgi:hypothetical protein
MVAGSLGLEGMTIDSIGIVGALLGLDPRGGRHEFREDDVHAVDEPHAVDGLRANLKSASFVRVSSR